jgi:predicted  nucleic acid-binding Zn-ribbon protein
LEGYPPTGLDPPPRDSHVHPYAMPSPAVEKLLILQDRDLKRLALEAQLKASPLEIAGVERTVATEKGAIDTAKAHWHELESKKKILETEIGSAQTKIGTYRTQQLGVRKNDEYQALGNQIITTQEQIGKLEGDELEIMYQIDAAKKVFAAAEAVMKQNISGYETRIKTLKERAVNLDAELVTAKAEVEKAREPVPVPALRVYDRRAPRGMPVVVPVKGGKCGGCHLKISSEAEAGSRGGGPEGELATCDQCGRIVYFDSN